MKIRLGLIVYSMLLYISCNTVIQEAQNWIEISNSSNPKELEGNYFKLDNTTVTSFLPEGFQKYNLSQYKTVLDSLLNKDQTRNEINRLESLRELKGSFHIFYESETRSTYTINTLPFFNFSKKDAAVLLAMIKQRNDQATRSTEFTFKKKTAAYAKNKHFTMFRSIFEINNYKENYTSHTTFYIISANKQTFMINLTTPFEVNFDGYIEKMKF